MIHTLTLVKEISYYEFNVLSDILCDLSKERKTSFYKDSSNKSASIKVCEVFKSKGLIIKVCKNEIAKYACLELRLNPRRIIESDQFVSVTKENDFPNIAMQFKLMMDPVQKRLIDRLVEKSVIASSTALEMLKGKNGMVTDITDLGSYKVSRIDYCINVKSEMASVYMRLIRQGDVPPKFFMKKNVDPKTGKTSRYKDSMYLYTKSKDIKINFYDKAKEMESKRDHYGDEKIEEAINILRFEIQCSGTKVNNMKAYYGLKSKELNMLAINQLALETVVGYYNEVVGKEGYVTLNVARQCVMNCTIFTNNEKKRMVEILELVNQKRSIYEARKAFIQEKGGSKECKKVFNWNLSRIRKLSINPVTIPVNWGIEKLPNLYDEIIKAGVLPGQYVVTYGLHKEGSYDHHTSLNT